MVTWWFGLMQQGAAHMQVQKKRRPSSTQSLVYSDVENKVLEARGLAKLAMAATKHLSS